MKAQFIIASFAAVAFAQSSPRDSASPASSDKAGGASPPSGSAKDDKDAKAGSANETKSPAPKSNTTSADADKPSNGYALAASVAMSAIAAFAASFPN